MFDLVPERESRHVLEADLPLDGREWKIGLITGPSGCGKSTLARQAWPEAMERKHQWGKNSILDAFPEQLSIKEVVFLLSSVGFSSPPAWLRSYGSLSTGQQFRADLALALAHASVTPPHLVVLDEFTSVVDRTVAKIGSAAVARAVRKHENLRFIAVSCHEDIVEWLQPDWLYRPNENHFLWRCLPGRYYGNARPSIALSVVRCQKSAWKLFAPHHYLSHDINPSAVCFLASWEGKPVAFSAWLPFVGAGPPTRREHRTVCLPDYQGVGIGNVLSALLASMWKGLGFRAISTTTHPSMIQSRKRSPLWKMHREPSLASSHEGKLKHATTRLTAGFTYLGEPMDRFFAERLLAS